MPINSDGTLRLPRPEPVAYDDTEMEPDGLRVICVRPADVTFGDELDKLRQVNKDWENVDA